MTGLTDFNDMADAEAIRRRVESAIPITSGMPISGATDPVPLTRSDTHLNGATPAVQTPFQSFGPLKMEERGLLVEISRKVRGENIKKVVWVCKPFEVVGRVRCPDGRDWARVLKFRDADGSPREALVADAELHGDPRAIAAHLASLGLRIACGCANHLANYINETSASTRITRVQHTGWHTVRGRECFVLPTATLGLPPGELVRLDGGSGPFEIAGTRADWKNGVGRLVADHTRSLFMVSAAFAAPLLRCAKLDGGGVHLYGNSSAGKTTVLAAAASVWGRGSTGGFVKTWRSTANGLEATAAHHTDVALPLDELGVVDARDAFAAVYQLAAGQGKQRARRDGSIRDSKTWRVLVLSTGETRLRQKLAEGRQRAMAGQDVRLLDIPADAGQGFGVFDGPGEFESAKELADAINQSARTHFGSAGPAFVAAVIEQGVDKISTAVLDHVGRFRSHVVVDRADGQVLRAADRFGLIAAAGELATALDITPWEPGSAREAAIACFHAWLDTRGGTEAQEVIAAIAQVRAFIEAHGDARFECLDGSSPRPVANRVGYRRNAGRDQQWLVSPEAWKRELAVGFDPKDTARWLADRGYLVRANDGFQTVVKVAGRAQRFYLLTAKLLENQSTDVGSNP